MNFFCEWFEVSEDEYAQYEQAFPGMDMTVEFMKMGLWLYANPARRKRNYKRFIVNWLSNAHRRLLEVELRETVRHQLRRGEAKNY